MNEALSKSQQEMFSDLPSATSSPASPDGPTRSGSPAGPKIVPSGPPVVRVSRFRARDSEKAMPTKDTCGPLFIGSSPSAVLQRSLESRLRARMDVNGSPEYALTWKEWDMPSGVPICALRAQGHPTSGNGFTGWPTPREGSEEGYETRNQRKGHGQAMSYLESCAEFACGWTRPTARDWKDTPGMATEGTNPDGSIRERLDQLPRQANLCGWNSPRATDGSNGGPNQAGGALPNDASKAGWVSPTAQDHSRGAKPPRPHDTGIPLTQQISGMIPSGIPAQTESSEGYLLNPRFSLWLQGYPDEWACSGARAMQSTRKSPRSS